MKYRKLGRQGPRVSALGLGCMSIGIADTYSSSVENDDDAVALIHHALDLGITLLDTADIYGNSERQVGKALKGRRDQAVLATKFGFQTGVSANARAEAPEGMIDGSPRYVRQPAMPRSSGSAWTTLICTTSTAWTRRRPSKTPSARWRIS